MKVIKFGASWCGPCRTVGPILHEVVNEIGNIELEDIDIEENEELIQQYKVKSVPTIVLIDNDGKELSRKTGSLSKNQLTDWLNEFNS